MERKITVQNNQSLLDIANMAGGSIESVFDIVEALGGISITDEITPGTLVDCTNVEVLNREVYEYYLNHSIAPATAKNFVPDVVTIGEGIGSWTIGDTFIIQ